MESYDGCKESPDASKACCARSINEVMRSAKILKPHIKVLNVFRGQRLSLLIT